jgi:hypothetical protein
MNILRLARWKPGTAKNKSATYKRQTHAIVSASNGRLRAACGFGIPVGFAVKGKPAVTCSKCKVAISAGIPAVEPSPPAADKALRVMEYGKYLKTPHWRTFRKKVLTHWDNRCCICYGSEALNVHHRTYRRRGKEELTDCVVLCASCHELHHHTMKISITS